VTIDGWALACLAAMAVALVAMALGQIILAVTAVRMARESLKVVNDLRADVKPVLDNAQRVLENVQRIADHASQVTSLALVQMERVDSVMASSIQRIDDTMDVVQQSVVRPLRQGAALMAGVKAAVEHFVKRPDRPRHGREDEDALFVG